MRLGDRVRVKQSVSEDTNRGRIGIVSADTAPGELVKVEFVDESIDHYFSSAELELIVSDEYE
jgi:hypothetical protein